MVKSRYLDQMEVMINRTVCQGNVIMIHGLTIDSRSKRELIPSLASELYKRHLSLYREVCMQPPGSSNQLNVLINSRLKYLDHLHCPRLQGTKRDLQGLCGRDHRPPASGSPHSRAHSSNVAFSVSLLPTHSLFRTMCKGKLSAHLSIMVCCSGCVYHPRSLSRKRDKEAPN